MLVKHHAASDCIELQGMLIKLANLGISSNSTANSMRLRLFDVNACLIHWA